MYHVSAQGVNERMINVHYYYYKHTSQPGKQSLYELGDLCSV